MYPSPTMRRCVRVYLSTQSGGEHAAAGGGRRHRGRRARWPRRGARPAQERGPQRGAGVVAGAPGVGIRLRRVAQRLPRARRPRHRRHHQEPPPAGAGAARHVFLHGRGGEAPPHEVEFRCVRRDVLLQVLEAELPKGTVRCSSKIVSIQDLDQHGGDDDGAKIVHLADGSTLRAKVLIGCDGINSVVARWLGLAKPSYSGRSAARGLAHYPGGHALKPKFLQFFGQGFRFGYVPCNANDVYWFYTWSPSPNDDNDVDKSSAKMKQYVLTKLRSSKVPEEALELVERSEMSDDAPATQLRFRSPLSLMLAEINKGNVSVAGDALHPMTPDLGQGGCAALEDGVVLARCLGDAILGDDGTRGGAEKERIVLGLRKYAGIRRWRSIELIGTAYIVGFLQQSNNVVVSFLRERVLAGALARRLVRMSNYDCGTLSN